MRQNNADWICAVPYGYYMIDSKNMTYEVDEACAEVVRRIFEMYNGGMGYKKIANTLTDEKIPTPRMVEIERKRKMAELNKKRLILSLRLRLFGLYRPSAEFCKTIFISAHFASENIHASELTDPIKGSTLRKT